MTKVEWGLQLYRGEISVRELRSMFPAGPGNNTVVFPGDPRSLCIAESIWVPPRSGGEREALGVLLEQMCGPTGWKSYETNRKTDDLRDKHLIHHFHLDERTGSRSNYRWFAFRDPGRFGNVWFNLGGTYATLDDLKPLWTSPIWFQRMGQLYPWVASRYRIRGGRPIPAYPQLQHNVRSIWHNKSPDVYGVVRVGDDIYICPGMAIGAPLIDLDHWIVFSQRGGMFAKFVPPDPEELLSAIRAAREEMDTLEEA